MTAGLLQHPLAGSGEDDPAAEGVSLEGGPGDGLARAPVRRRASLARGQRSRAVHRHVDQDGRRNDVVHQPELPRLRGPDRPASEDEVEGGLEADEPREPLGAARAGEQPELHLGKPELGTGSVRRHAAPAGQRPLQAPAEAGAVDGGHDGLGEEGQPIEPVLPLVRGALSIGRAPE